MTGTEPCPCGASREDHDVYGNCPDRPSPVTVSVGVVVRRLIVPTAAVAIAAVSIFATGFYTGHNTPRGCTYGTLHMRNGDVATSSVPGVDALCDNGVMIRFAPTQPRKPAGTD